MKPAISPEQNPAVALCRTLIAVIASQFDISVETLHADLLREHNSPDPIQAGCRNEPASQKAISEEQNQRYISSNEVAYLLDIKPQTLRKQICSDSLPQGFPRPLKCNGRNKWIRSDINAYFAKKHPN